jgi:hypothetical protein
MRSFLLRVIRRMERAKLSGTVNSVATLLGSVSTVYVFVTITEAL